MDCELDQSQNCLLSAPIYLHSNREAIRYFSFLGFCINLDPLRGRGSLHLIGCHGKEVCASDEGLSSAETVLEGAGS